MFDLSSPVTQKWMRIAAGVLGIAGVVLWPNCTSRYNMDMSSDEISTRITLSVITLVVAAVCFFLSVYSEFKRRMANIERMKERDKKRKK